MNDTKKSLEEKVVDNRISIPGYVVCYDVNPTKGNYEFLLLNYSKEEDSNVLNEETIYHFPIVTYCSNRIEIFVSDIKKLIGDENFSIRRNVAFILGITKN